MLEAEPGLKDPRLEISETQLSGGTFKWLFESRGGKRFN